MDNLGRYHDQKQHKMKAIFCKCRGRQILGNFLLLLRHERVCTDRDIKITSPLPPNDLKKHRVRKQKKDLKKHD